MNILVILFLLISLILALLATIGASIPKIHVGWASFFFFVLAVLLEHIV